MSSSSTAAAAVSRLPPPAAPPAARSGSKALAALTHPLSLSAIALLLLNDHVFKRAFPSALTGKLSDFAGLFFFPFLLAALVALAGGTGLRRRELSVTAACLLTTGLTFALIKLDPTSNAAAVRVLGDALGSPVRIVRDPTDLIALAALWPAWRLWRTRTTREPLRSPRGLLALGLASLASLATAPCPPVASVARIVVEGEHAYALMYPESPEGSVFRSDTGIEWSSLDPADIPSEVSAQASTPTELTKTVCVPGLELTCYRAAGGESLQSSSDGGASWRTEWSPPSARRSFMQRVAEGHGQMLACGKSIDFRSLDVAVLGSGPGHSAVVVLGNEGVLVGRAGGDWSRVGVGLAEPTPERVGLLEPGSPGLILGETVAAVVAAAAAAVYFSSVAWRRYRVPEAQGGPKRSDLPWKTGVVATLLIGVLMFALNVEALIPYAVLPVVGLVTWAVILWTGWLQTLRGTRETKAAWSALALSALGSAAVGLAVWTPFALWVSGTIAGYPTAVLIAVGSVIGMMALFRSAIAGRGRPDVEPAAGASS